MLDASGIWSINYFATADARDGNVDPQEMATLHLSPDGKVSGNDPFGGKYSGSYSVQQNLLRASVLVEKNYDEAITVFESLDFPLQIELQGNYTSPDIFVANCTVNDASVLLISGRRLGDLV